MSEFVSLEKIELKNNNKINEDMIQSYIFNNPSVLGLGELSPVRREKILTSGGRLDILLSDGQTHYEVEVQLGSIDPSHIIRTIEYWDLERKRFPQYEHCAVLVAENATRYLNVLQIFNGFIPLMVYQVNAYKNGDNVALDFVKILDKVTLGNEDENTNEEATRSFWEEKSSDQSMKLVDDIYNDLCDVYEGYDLKYNKFYIGLIKDGMANNFTTFKPKKKYVNFCIRIKTNQEILDLLNDSELTFIDNSRWNEYLIRIDSFEKYVENKDLIKKLALMSKAYMEE